MSQHRLNSRCSLNFGLYQLFPEYYIFSRIVQNMKRVIFWIPTIELQPEPFKILPSLCIFDAQVLVYTCILQLDTDFSNTPRVVYFTKNKNNILTIFS